MKLSAEKPQDVPAAIETAREAVRGMVVRGLSAPNTYHHGANGVERIGSLTGPPYMEISHHKEADGSTTARVVAEIKDRSSGRPINKKAVYAYDRDKPEEVKEATATNYSFIVTQSADPEVYHDDKITHDPKDARAVILAVHEEIARRTRSPRKRNFLTGLRREPKH